MLQTRVPAEVAATMARPSASVEPAEPVESVAEPVDPDSDSDQVPGWPWLVGGGLAFVVGAGWLLTRRGQAS